MCTGNGSYSQGCLELGGGGAQRGLRPEDILEERDFQGSLDW